jgi:hypothetical protein
MAKPSSITRRIFVLSIGAAIVHPVPNLTAAPRVRDPATIVKEIYAAGDSRSTAFGLDPKERRKYFSKSIDTMWTRAEAKVKGRKDAVSVIDWDLSTNSQGMEVESYTHRIEMRDATHLIVEVTLTAKYEWIRNSPDENIIRYHFIRENDRWVIDDIRHADDDAAGGLRHILAEALKASDRRR